MAQDKKSKPQENDVENLFESGQDVESLFEGGEDVQQPVSAAEGLLSGAQKGATLGFADELAGAAGALGGLVGGDVRPLSEIYGEAKKEYAEEQKAIEQGAPTASMIGSIAGSALTTLPFAAGASLGKGLTLGQQALVGAKEAAKAGAAIGSLQGLGESQESDFSALLGDTLKGGLTGATLGGAVGGATPVVTQAAKGLASGARRLLKVSDFTDDLAKSVEEGLQGRLLFGEGAKRRVERDVVKAKELAETEVEKALKEAGEAQTAVLKTGEELGEKVDLMPIYKQAEKQNLAEAGISLPEKQASSRLSEELKNLMAEANSSNLVKSQKHKQALQRLSKMGMERDAYPQSPETSRILEKTSLKVKEALEKPFEEANKENILRAANKRYEAAKLAEEELPKISDITKLSKDFQPEVRNKFEQFSKLLEEASPQSKVESIITGKPSAAATMQKAAEDFERVRRLSRGGISGMEQIWGAISTLPAKTLNVASLGVNKATTSTADVVGSLAKLPKDQSLKLADWFANNGQTGIASLVKQTAEAPGPGKNAALFMLSQNPEFKKFVFGEEEPKEE